MTGKLFVNQQKSRARIVDTVLALLGILDNQFF